MSGRELASVGETKGRLMLAAARLMPNGVLVDVSSGFTVRYDASDTLTITESGGLVSQWNDKSGNGYHLTSSTTKPTTGSVTQNGRNALSFPGSKYMNSSSFSAALSTGTVYVVGSCQGNPNNYFTDGYGASGRWAFGSNLLGTSKIDCYAGTGFATSIASTSPVAMAVWVVKFNGASSAIWRDGSSVATGNAGSQTLSLLRVGANTSAAQSLNGVICEVIVYGTVHDDATIQSNSAALKTKWGTP